MFWHRLPCFQSAVLAVTLAEQVFDRRERPIRDGWRTDPRTVAAIEQADQKYIFHDMAIRFSDDKNLLGFRAPSQCLPVPRQ